MSGDETARGVTRPGTPTGSGHDDEVRVPLGAARGTAGAPSATRPGRGAAIAIAVTLATLAARLAYMHSVTQGHWSGLRYPDETTYLTFARLAGQDFFAYFRSERALWAAPLHLVWLLALGMNAVLLKVVHLVLLSVVGLMVWDCASRKAGRVAGLWALGLCTIHWPFFDYGTTLLTEAPFVFLVTLSFWLFDRAAARRRFVAAAGLVMGLACLIRSAVQLWPFAVTSAYLTIGALRAGWRRWHAPARDAPRSGADPLPKCGIRSPVGRDATTRWLIFTAAFLAVVGPYVGRNAATFHRPTVANGAGASLYLGNDLRADGDEPVYSGREYDTITITAPYTHAETEGDRRLVERAVTGIKAHPGATVRLWPRKALRFLVGHPISYFFPFRDVVHARRVFGAWYVLRTVALLMLTTVTALFMGLTGALSDERDHSSVFVVSFVVYMAIVHAVTFATLRYAFPLFPLLAIYAGVCAERIRAHLSLRRVTWLEGFVPVSVAATAIALCTWNIGANLYEVSPETPSYYQQVRAWRDFSSWQGHDLQPVAARHWRATASDPYLFTAIDPLAAEINETFFVSLRACRPAGAPDRGVAQIFWSGDDHFTPEAAATFDVSLDGKHHTYRITPSRHQRWSGEIRRVRLDLVGGAPGVRYELDSVLLAR